MVIRDKNEQGQLEMGGRVGDGRRRERKKRLRSEWGLWKVVKKSEGKDRKGQRGLCSQGRQE